MKRKNFFSFTALMLLVCVLLSALAGCAKSESDEVAALKAENESLKSEIAVLNARLAELESAGFKTWKLSAVAWSDSNGATVTFTGEPRTYEDGMSASISVRLEGEEIENVPCSWDGSMFKALIELEAADGYSYTCTLVGSDSAREQILLSSPDMPIYDTLVYMKSNLNAYCNLFVADWEEADEKLNITSGFVQVQLPQITPDGSTVSYTKSQLIFQLNGNTIETQSLELPAGEGSGSYETALTSVSFNMPKMDEDYQLDLLLSVTLSTGEVITASGGSWYYNNGQLSMVVG